jgi:hypothetical protein
MRIYKCVFTNDEVLCDNDQPLKVVDDVVYEVQGKWIEIGGEDFGISANVDDEAAEGATAEGQDNGKTRVINVVNQNRLAETSYDKKSYMAYIKGYMKKLKERLDENDAARSAAFMAGAQTFVKKVIAEFDEYQFFLPESQSDEGIIILAKWVGEDAFFYYWKDGLRGEKV